MMVCPLFGRIVFVFGFSFVVTVIFDTNVFLCSLIYSCLIFVWKPRHLVAPAAEMVDPETCQQQQDEPSHTAGNDD